METFSLFQIIQSLVSLVVLICFFVLVSHVGKLKSKFASGKIDALSTINRDISKAEFCNNNSEVIRLCHLAAWHIIDENKDFNQSYVSRELVPYLEKITRHGGTPSPALAQFIIENPIPDETNVKRVTTSVDR